MDAKLTGDYKHTYTKVKQLIYDKKLNTFSDKKALNDLKGYLLILQEDNKDIEETDEELTDRFSGNMLPMTKLEKIFICFLFPTIYVGLLFLIKIIMFKQVDFNDINLATVLVLSIVFGWQTFGKSETRELYGIIIAFSMIVVVPIFIWIIPNFRFVAGVFQSIVVITVCAIIFGLIFGIQKITYNKWQKGNKNG